MRYKQHIFICENLRDAADPKGSCAAKGSAGVRTALRKTLKERGLAGSVRANSAGCLDACGHGAAIVVYPDGVWYGGVTEQDVTEIVESHIEQGRPVERLRIKDARYTPPTEA